MIVKTLLQTLDSFFYWILKVDTHWLARITRLLIHNNKHSEKSRKDSMYKSRNWIVYGPVQKYSIFIYSIYIYSILMIVV